jgi:hypothetical protein
MKRTILFIAILAFAISCQNNEPESQSQDGAQSVQEEKSSASGILKEGMTMEEKIATIEAEIERIQKANLKTPLKRVKLTEDSGSIGVLEHEGKPFRIAKKTTPANEEWMTIYYILNNNVILYKQREWISHTNPPYAKEVTCYMDGNGIFNAAVRRADLEPGQNPSGVLGLPPSELKLDKDSLYRAILSDFKDLQQIINKNQ